MMTVFQAFHSSYEPTSQARQRTLQEYRYKLKRWERIVGAIAIDKVSPQVFDQFRKKALSAGLSPDTIESTISVVVQVLRFCVESEQLTELPHRGARLRLSRKVRYVPPLEDLGRMYAAAGAARWPTWCPPGEFWRPLLVAAYWTALRHFDLFWTLSVDCLTKKSIVLTSHKTDKEHIFPRHPVFDRHMAAAPQRRGEKRCFPIDVCRKQVLRELHRMADAAQVPHFTLHAIRRLSCSEWQDAKWGAGEVVQGSAIKGSASRYIVPQILRQAAPLMRWPDEMLTPEERDEAAQQQARLLLAVQKLGDTERQAVLSLAEKLAT